MNKTSIILTIAILGGTGKEGKGLAYRWAHSGYRVLIGSRSRERAQATADDLTILLEGKSIVEGMHNLEAAQKADVIVVTVPYPTHREMLETIRQAAQGKLVIDVTVPLVPPKVTKVQMPPAGSAAQEARQILGEGVEVCTAFQNISHELLMGRAPIECDVLVTGTSKEARAETLKLVEAAGLKGWDAGPLENSVVVEGLTSILIHINKNYNSTRAGIKISGV
jgi:NADPH-dependent F420 reductase